MSHVQWQEKYSVNISIIDEQHKKITELLNVLFDAIEKNQTQSVLAKVIKEVVDYADYHFRTEETFMVQYLYPEYEEHKKEHDDFRAKAIQLQKDVQNGKQTVTLEILNLLMGWLDHHIMEIDKKYGPFLNEKGIF